MTLATSVTATTTTTATAPTTTTSLPALPRPGLLRRQQSPWMTVETSRASGATRDTEGASLQLLFTYCSMHRPPTSTTISTSTLGYDSTPPTRALTHVSADAAPPRPASPRHSLHNLGAPRSRPFARAAHRHSPSSRKPNRSKSKTFVETRVRHTHLRRGRCVAVSAHSSVAKQDTSKATL
jgi:hypothetical protein